MPRLHSLAGLLGLALTAGFAPAQLPQSLPPLNHTQTPPVAMSPQAPTAPAAPAKEEKEKASLNAPHPCNTFERAGYPNEIGKCAGPSNTCAYDGYYVGGGCVCWSKGGPPGPLEGTWGWDYFGKKFRRHVVLGFCYDCRYQGGGGSYSPDRGPHIPNIFAIKLPERPHAHGECHEAAPAKEH